MHDNVSLSAPLCPSLLTEGKHNCLLFVTVREWRGYSRGLNAKEYEDDSELAFSSRATSVRAIKSLDGPLVATSAKLARE